MAVEIPASVELDHHRDRARRAGRPGVGRPQAGHAGDRQGHPGAAVRERRRPGARSTPAPATTSPGSEARRSDDEREDQRSDARERAMGLLYEAQAKGAALADVLAAPARRPRPAGHAAGRGRRRPPGRDRRPARRRTPAGWTLERMPVLDRTVMEIATFELLARPDVPTPVVHRRGRRAGQALQHGRLRPLRQRGAVGHRERSARARCVASLAATRHPLGPSARPASQ